MNLDEIPQMVPKKAPDSTPEMQEEELRFLAEGARYLRENRPYAALTPFKAAMRLYDSPLGNLYSAALEDNNHFQTRLWAKDAASSLAKNSIGKKDYILHLTYVRHYRSTRDTECLKKQRRKSMSELPMSKEALLQLPGQTGKKMVVFF